MTTTTIFRDSWDPNLTYLIPENQRDARERYKLLVLELKRQNVNLPKLLSSSSYRRGFNSFSRTGTFPFSGGNSKKLSGKFKKADFQSASVCLEWFSFHIGRSPAPKCDSKKPLADIGCTVSKKYKRVIFTGEIAWLPLTHKGKKISTPQQFVDSLLKENLPVIGPMGFLSGPGSEFLSDPLAVMNNPLFVPWYYISQAIMKQKMVQGGLGVMPFSEGDSMIIKPKKSKLKYAIPGIKGGVKFYHGKTTGAKSAFGPAVPISECTCFVSGDILRFKVGENINNPTFPHIIQSEESSRRFLDTCKTHSYYPLPSRCDSLCGGSCFGLAGPFIKEAYGESNEKLSNPCKDKFSVPTVELY